MPHSVEIKQQNSAAIQTAISTLKQINYDTVSERIPALLAEGKLILDSSVYIPTDPAETTGIGRYLIYNHNSETEPFSIWAFALAPQQKTSIHDHKYKGTVTVLEGPVSEKYYFPTGQSTAQRIGRVDRFRFHTNTDNLTDAFVHQLKRRKGLGEEGTSVTLHIYAMPAHLITEEGKIVDARNLSQFFTKNKSVAHYKGDYQELKARP